MDNIIDKFDLILKHNSTIYEFITTLSKMSELIFFGGSIRNLYFSDEPVIPRDFDIVLNSSLEREKLESFIKKFNHKKNRFGGYKIYIDDMELDIWYLENTWAFREKKIKMSEENLIESVYLSIDGIAYNYNKQEIYDRVFEETKRKKVIDIVLMDNPQEELNLLRALVFRKRYNYNLSKNLSRKFTQYYYQDKNFIDNLFELQLDHYKVEKLEYKEIKKDVNEIILK